MIAVVMDFHTGRIPNQFILISLFSGLIYQIQMQGIKALLPAILGIIFPIILLFPIFTTKGLGAGDVKLFSVIGSFLSITEYRAILMLFIVSILIGGVQSIILMCVHRKYQSTIHFSIPILFSTIFYLGGFYCVTIF